MWQRFTGFILEAVNGMVKPVQEKEWYRPWRKSVEILFWDRCKSGQCPMGPDDQRPDFLVVLLPR